MVMTNAQMSAGDRVTVVVEASLRFGTRHRGRQAVALGLAMWLALVGTARLTSAQSNSAANAGVQYDFSNPGARSRAMGGAFIGLADDATAAVSNPAGLATLTTSEVWIEGRQSETTTLVPFQSTAQFGGAVLERGFTERVRGNSLRAAAFAGPQRWSIASYRSIRVNFESSAFSNGPFTDDGTGRRVRPFQTTSDVAVSELGVAAAYEFDGRLSLGFGVSYDQASVQSRADSFTSSPNIDDPTFASFAPEDLENFQTESGEANDIGYTIGARWRSRGDQFALGAVYSSGTEFALQIRNIDPRTGAPFPALLGGRLHDQSGTFRVPSRFGVGAAWSLAPVALVLDYVRVNYPELTRDLALMFFNEADRPAAREAFQTGPGHEVRAGAEWAIPLVGSARLYLRGGVWFDPAHQLTFADGGQSIGDFTGQASRVLFLIADDQVHYTAGAGVSVWRIRINAAYEDSDLTRSTHVSADFRF